MHRSGPYLLHNPSEVAAMSLTFSLHLSRSASVARARHRRVEPAPPLSADERVLQRSPDGDVVATTDALLLGDRVGQWRRIRWADIVWLGGSRADGLLTVRLWDGSQVHLPANARLAAVAQERIDAQRLLQVPAELGNGRRGTVVALRAGDAVQWRVLVDGPPDDPALAEACTRVIREIRALAGL
jgi:hypothetical protein